MHCRSHKRAVKTLCVSLALKAIIQPFFHTPDVIHVTVEPKPVFLLLYLLSFPVGEPIALNGNLKGSLDKLSVFLT